MIIFFRLGKGVAPLHNTLMRMTYKAGLLFIALLCLTSPLRAQEAGSTNHQQLMIFAANNSEFDNVVEDEAKALFTRQIDNCPKADKAVRQLPTAYGKINFPQDPTNQFLAPIYGVWVEHVKLIGCNKIWQINMLAVAREKTRPLLLAILPGETLSDPANMRAAERIGATIIKKADNTSCSDDARARYARFLGYKKQEGDTLSLKDAGLGWFEEWDFRFCQKTIGIQMAFSPNEKGGYEIKGRLADPAPIPQAPESKPVNAPAPSVPY